MAFPSLRQAHSLRRLLSNTWRAFPNLAVVLNLYGLSRLKTVDRNPHRRATFDATTPNQLDQAYGPLSGEQPLPLACTPAPTGFAAITGATEVCETSLNFVNTVKKNLRTSGALCWKDEIER